MKKVFYYLGFFVRFLIDIFFIPIIYALALSLAAFGIIIFILLYIVSVAFLTLRWIPSRNGIKDWRKAVATLMGELVSNIKDIILLSFN